jgi:hypothetical protein
LKGLKYFGLPRQLFSQIGKRPWKAKPGSPYPDFFYLATFLYRSLKTDKRDMPAPQASAWDAPVHGNRSRGARAKANSEWGASGVQWRRGAFEP